MTLSSPVTEDAGEEVNTSPVIFTQDSYVLHRGLAKGLFPCFQCLTTLLVTTFFLISNINLPWCVIWGHFLLSFIHPWRQRSQSCLTSGADAYAEVIFLVSLKEEDQPLSHLTSVQQWPHHHIKKCQTYQTGLGWRSSPENLRAGKGRKWEDSKKEKGQWHRTVAPSAWLCHRWNLPWTVCPALPTSVKNGPIGHSRTAKMIQPWVQTRLT